MLGTAISACWPAFPAQLADGGAKVEFDTVGLLQALLQAPLEQGAGERDVLGPAGARVDELILSHYLPAEPGAVTNQEWAERAGQGFSGISTAGRGGLRRTLTRASSSSA